MTERIVGEEEKMNHSEIDIHEIQKLMTKEEAITYIESANGKEIHLGLEVMNALMNIIDWPSRGQKIIHVTGTNGKGSVCEILGQILKCEGYKVGAFNTPYFDEPNECIRINGEKISDDQLTHYVSQLVPIVLELEAKGMKPSGFELLTAIALLYFKDSKVDYSILEVGLGGRLDATNIIQAATLSIITKIAIDHKNFLGDTLEAIAKEKAGIIKKEGLVVMPRQEESVMKVVEDTAKKQNAKLYIMEPEEIKLIQVTEEVLWFRYIKETYGLDLIGTYQAYNASIAIEAIKVLNQNGLAAVHQASIKNGLMQVKWPGRFEKMTQHPLIFIDGAHNVDGIKALTETLNKLPKRKTIAIVGILKDKEVEQMVSIIGPWIEQFVVTRPLNPRAMETKALGKLLKPYGKVYIEEDIEKALKLAINLSSEISNSQILGFGSLYMLGKLRKCVLKYINEQNM